MSEITSEHPEAPPETMEDYNMESYYPEDDYSQSHSDDDETTLQKQREIRNNRIKKLVIALLLVGFVVFVIVDSTTNGYVRSGIDSFLKWIENNPVAGCFVFVLVYFVATILFVPGLILTLGAGFVFGNAFGLGLGVVIATLSVFVGASTGAIAAFLLGRYLLRDWVQGFSKRFAILEALDVAFQEKGFRIMLLLRLSPIIPFNAINYIAGVTALSLRDYCLALFGILPGTILYVFLGSSAGSLADSANSGGDPTVTIIVVVVGVVFGILAVFVTSLYAKKELNKVVAAREAERQAQQVQEQEDVSIELGTDDDDDMLKDDDEMEESITEEDTEESECQETQEP